MLKPKKLRFDDLSGDLIAMVNESTKNVDAGDYIKPGQESPSLSTNTNQKAKKIRYKDLGGTAASNVIDIKISCCEPPELELMCPSSTASTTTKNTVTKPNSVNSSGMY